MNYDKSSLQTLIHNLDTQINDMEQKITKVEADAQVEYQQRIDDLKDRKREAEQKLEELGSTGGDVVEDIRTSIQQAWDDVKQAVNDAVGRFS